MSDEAKMMIKAWVEQQKAKYGPDWKAIKAKEMSEGPIGQTAVRLMQVLQALKK